jgi:phosphatidylinositol alpha-1,6-mannosyltransferase
MSIANSIKNNYQKIRKSLLLTLEFPPQKGGTQKYYFNICNNLPSDKIVVLAPRVETQNFASLLQCRIYRRKLLTKLIWPHWLPMVWHLWRVIKKEKIELIQVGQVLPCGTAVMIINKLLKIPYIVYTHGLDILNQPKGSKQYKLKQLILTEAQKVISNSEFVKNEVVKMGIERDKVEVVYPSVTPPAPPIRGATKRSSPIRGATKRSSPIRGATNVPPLIGGAGGGVDLQNKKILLTVCRLVERKGVDLVIQALSKISEQVQDLVYVVVGDGSQKENLEKFGSESGVEIIFTGRISDEELSAWYKICDAFILTPKKSESDVEGFGIVYLEANSYSKPVIGSRVGGVVEAIQNGVSGILVEPDNVEEIGQAIVKLFSDDELREKLGRQGRERVERDFSFEQQIKWLKQVLSY